MFRECVTQTVLSNSTAEDYFGGIINGSSYRGDLSFVSTLRALLKNRIGENHLRFDIFNGYINDTDFNLDLSPKEKIGLVIPDYTLSNSDYTLSNEKDYICLINLTGNADQNTRNIKLFAENIEGAYPNFKRVQDVTELFKSTFEVLCFINPENRGVLLICSKLDIRKYHYLQCCIPGIMPWYFENKPINDLEKKLLYSFVTAEKVIDSDGNEKNEYTSAMYLRCIEEIAATFDLEATRLKKLLDGFEMREQKKTLQSIENQIRDVRNYIDDYQNRISNKIEEMRDLNLKYIGIQKMISSGEGENIMYEYFKRNKRLHLDRIDNNYLYFTVRDYLQFFSESVAKDYIDYKRSEMYQHLNPVMTEERAEALMKAIFLDQTVKVRFYAKYMVNFKGTVSALDKHSSMEYTDKDSMPNPHIYYHHCLGDNTEVLVRLAKDGDYVGCIEQCVCSCRSLNLHDSTVFREFMEDICRKECAAICELPDGRIVKPFEAADWAIENN